MEFRFQDGVFSGKDDDLNRMFEFQKRFQHHLGRTHTESPGGDQQDGQIGIKAEFPSDAMLFSMMMIPEGGIDRDPADSDPLEWKPELAEMNLGLLQGDKVTVEGAGQPHRVEI